MPSKKPRLNPNRFENQELKIIRAQFGQFAKGYLERLSDLETIGLTSPVPIWSNGPELFGFDDALEDDFRKMQLHRVERCITDWAFTPEGAATMEQRLKQHERYKLTGNPADGGFTASGLFLEQLRKRDLGRFARIRMQLEEKVLEARYADMERLGFNLEGDIVQSDSLRNKRAVVCALVDEQGLGFKREPKAGGFISFGRQLCEGWVLRIRIVEGDLLRTMPMRMPTGRLSIGAHKMHLEIVDLEQNRYATFALEDLIPISNSLASNVFSRIYDSLDQLLFVVQASVMSYSTVASEFESCLLQGIEQLGQFRNG